MSRGVLRETVPVDDHWHEIQIRGPILHVATRGENYVEVWFLADSSITHWSRGLRVFGTGQPVPDGAAYVGTAIVSGGSLVWHLFERTGSGAGQ